ncbi:peptidoglycan-binding protein [Rossellomorea sp. GAMAL-10_SWC]
MQVKKIQVIISVKVDGIFGTLTEKAVKEFQRKNDLVVDGIVGVKTWGKLFNPTNL